MTREQISFLLYPRQPIVLPSKPPALSPGNNSDVQWRSDLCFAAQIQLRLPSWCQLIASQRYSLGPGSRFSPALVRSTSATRDAISVCSLHGSAGRAEECGYFFSRTTLRSVIQRRDCLKVILSTTLLSQAPRLVYFVFSSLLFLRVIPSGQSKN